MLDGQCQLASIVIVIQDQKKQNKTHQNHLGSSFHCTNNHLIQTMVSLGTTCRQLDLLEVLQDISPFIRETVSQVALSPQMWGEMSSRTPVMDAHWAVVVFIWQEVPATRKKSTSRNDDVSSYTSCALICIFFLSKETVWVSQIKSSSKKQNQQHNHWNGVLRGWSVQKLTKQKIRMKLKQWKEPLKRLSWWREEYTSITNKRKN